MNENAATKETGLVSRVISIFWEPSKTFKAVSRKSNWWDIIIPILLITITAWVTIPYITPISIQDAKARIEKSERLTDAQKENALESMGERSTIMQYATTPISLFIMVVIIAMVMWLAGNFLLSGEQKFVPIFAMTSYVYLINILANLVKTPLMVAKNSTKVYTGLATLFPESESFLFSLAKKFDIFAIWKVVLLGIGLGILYKSKQSKSITVVFIVWLTYAIIASLLSGLSPF